MARKSEHLATAERFENFAEWILANAPPDNHEWCVVLLFYAAAHYGRAMLAALGKTTFSSHSGFETEFHAMVGDRALFRYYMRMKDESERARYDCVQFSPDELKDIKEKHFDSWKREVMKRIKGLESPRSK